MVAALLSAAATVACFTPSRPKPTSRAGLGSPIRETRPRVPEEPRASPNDLSVPSDEAWLVVLNSFERRVLIYDEQASLRATIPAGQAQIVKLTPGEHSLYATVGRTIRSLDCGALDCAIGTAKARFEAGCMYFARTKRRPYTYPTPGTTRNNTTYARDALELVRESNLATSVWWPKTVILPAEPPQRGGDFGGQLVWAGNAQRRQSNVTWERNDEFPLCSAAIIDAGADGAGGTDAVETADAVRTVETVDAVRTVDTVDGGGEAPIVPTVDPFDRGAL